MESISWPILIMVWGVACLVSSSRAADWPHWRYDARRSAASPERLPAELHLRWVREYPPLRPAYWQVRQERVQFDQGYEPVVAGSTVFIGSSLNDRLNALDTETGAERWHFYADGPIRLAPAVWQGKVYLASDDGCLYCLRAEDGTLLWKRRASPSPRKVIGNGRLVSAWPARGGPVVADGRVYFAAGVWPFEGIFVYALDAQTGEVIWVNDRCGSLYMEHPHGAMSFGGPSPQGYLLLAGKHLVVPSSRAFPAFFHRDTGELTALDFGHGGHGSRPGGWFVAADAEGRLVVDSEINTETHDAGQQIIGQQGVRRVEGELLTERIQIGQKTYEIQPGARGTISVGGRTYRFRDGFPGVNGDIHAMVAAAGRLFVVTRQGSIYCFGHRRGEPNRYGIERQEGALPHDEWGKKAEEILGATAIQGGFALVWGLESGRLVEELALQSSFHVVAVDRDPGRVDALRRRLDRAGLYGTRASVHTGDPPAFGLPPYMASLLVSENPDAAGISSSGRFVEELFRVLRPYGGTACLEIDSDQHAMLATWHQNKGDPSFKLQRHGGSTLLIRRGLLPGAANYTGNQNFDQLVRAPLGLLWFGDTFHHHKLFYKGFYHETGRGLPMNIDIVDGLMRYAVTEQPYGPNRTSMGYQEYLRHLEQYKRYSDAYIDVYTGRVLSVAEAEKTPFPDHVAKEPTSRGNLWLMPAVRRNPLTGIRECREFSKTYGCDRTPVDYGHLFTMRSGTAAFYDKRSESGTINVSGLRSGCRNSMVPACGVLALPSWTGNCTCNYPLYTSLALAPMAPSYEQWSAWGDVAANGAIEKVGINFGAPGDRMTENGTLWLDYPSVGGPSPEVPVRVTPHDVEWYYRHALWIEGNQPWPWVHASGVRGVRAVRIEPVARKSGVSSDWIGIHWAGMIQAESTEAYTFDVESDGNVQLWIGDELVLDSRQNRRRNQTGTVTGRVAMEAETKTAIRVEYVGPTRFEDGKRHRVQLRWASASVPENIVPPQNLFTADGRQGGLTAAYYDSKFAGPAVLTIDPTVDLDWSEPLPPPLQEATAPAKAHGEYTVTLYFAEPEQLKAGQRVFSVAIQRREVLTDFDIVREAGGPMRGVVRSFQSISVEKELVVSLTPKLGEPLLSGIRLVAEK